MRYLTVGEVIELHRQILEATRGARGIRTLDVLESAAAQPRATFGGSDLYEGLVEKAAALGFSLIRGHAFVDGNKRVGHAAMETFLVLNGYEIDATVDEQESVILGVASGTSDLRSLTNWLRDHVRIVKPD